MGRGANCATVRMTDGSSAGFRGLEYSFVEYQVLNTTLPRTYPPLPREMQFHTANDRASAGILNCSIVLTYCTYVA